jgi:hypothetical protein
MDVPQYAQIIDSIPTFSGEAKENVNDWLDIVSLKFDIMGYEAHKKRRFIPQYLAGNALKWHLAHRDELSSWEDYTAAITTAFPRIITMSRDMNLQMLKDRKQLENESFTEYYTSIVDFCQKHDPDMTDLQIIDWLKAGMKITLYEKLQGEEFARPQALLLRAQRVELDNAVLAARKRECTAPTPAISVTPRYSYNNTQRWTQPTYYQPRSFSTYTPSHTSPLMSTPYSAPSYVNTPQFRSAFPSQSSPHPYSPTANSSISPPRAIVCYSCGQPGHISPNCPFPVHNLSTAPRRPISCYTCGEPGHISPHCPSRPKE